MTQHPVVNCFHRHRESTGHILLRRPFRGGKKKKKKKASERKTERTQTYTFLSSRDVAPVTKEKVKKKKLPCQGSPEGLIPERGKRCEAF